MERSYHGLYSDWIADRFVGGYFNQKPGEGRAYLAEINFLYLFQRIHALNSTGAKQPIKFHITVCQLSQR